VVRNSNLTSRRTPVAVDALASERQDAAAVETARPERVPRRLLTEAALVVIVFGLALAVFRDAARDVAYHGDEGD
jgi:hypothetical protein